MRLESALCTSAQLFPWGLILHRPTGARLHLRDDLASSCDRDRFARALNLPDDLQATMFKIRNRNGHPPYYKWPFYRLQRRLAAILGESFWDACGSHSFLC